MNKTVYQQVRTVTDEITLTSRDEKTEPRVRKRLQVVYFINLFLSLLWLAPIIALLYLNFTSYVIGANPWCPHRHCYFNPFAKTSFITAKEYDHNAHNLLGALQLVAKALEVWFVFVASGLIYVIANYLASCPSGLPLGLHASYVEFSDLRLLLSPTFWKTPLAVRSRNKAIVRRRHNWSLWIFVIFVALLCLLCNLMGPAVAVLVLPTLRQVRTPSVHERIFLEMDSASVPAGNSTIPYCTTLDFEANNYSCSWYAYGTTLDAWIASGKAYDYQVPYVISRWPNGTNPASNVFESSQAMFAVSQEWAVSFAFNASANDNSFYAPNRQVLRNMSADLENFYEVSTGTKDTFDPQTLLRQQDPQLRAILGDSDTGFIPTGPDDTFEQLRDSLQTQLQRSGPLVGASINFYQALDWELTEVDNQTFIFCSLGWSPLAAADPNWNSTKCHTLGMNWPSGSNVSVVAEHELTIPWQVVTVGANNVSTVNITMEMFWANQAVVYNDTYGKDLADQLQSKGCLGTAQVPEGVDCEWDTFFSQPAPDEDYPYILQNIHVIAIGISGLTTTNDVQRFIIEFSPNVSLAEYALDTSPYTNEIRLTEIVNPDIGNTSTPIYVHPSWLVAMFSGEFNDDPAYTDINNETAPYLGLSTTSGAEIAQTFSDLATGYTGSREMFQHLQTGDAEAQRLYRNLFYMTYLTTLHLCSMLSFSTDPMPELTAPKPDPAKVLSRQASITVWGYGIDSRTSVLGIMITVIGMVVVLLHFILGLLLRTPVKEPTELLAAALKHHQVSLDDGESGQVGRVRFVTREGGDGEHVYEKVD